MAWSHLLRRVAVAVAASAGLVLVLALVLPDVAVTVTAARDGSWREASFDDLLVRVCSVAALAAGTCWWIGVLRLVVAAAPGADTTCLPAPAGLPPWLRRGVLTACGTLLVAAPCAPALAAAEGPGTDPVAALALPAATGDLPTTGPGGLPLPDRVAGTPARHQATRRAAPRPVARPAARPADRPAATGAAAPTTVRVAAGDSLWRIAEAQLRAAGDPVDDAAVAARWQEIYAVNAERIGPDPDLVLPGVQLDVDRPARP